MAKIGVLTTKIFKELAIFSLLAIIVSNSCCLVVMGSSLTEYKPGVKAGEWIEYNIERNLNPDLYPNKTRREILEVNGRILKINITFWYPNGTVDSRIGEGDVVDGSGYCFLFFIPANLTKGSTVSRVNFANIPIIDELEREYLNCPRVVLYARFSGKGFNGSVYWDKIKGVALELNLTQGNSFSSFHVSATNMFSSGTATNGTLLYLILYLLTFLVVVVAGSFYYLISEKKRTSRRRKLGLKRRR